ncbi:GNAT family N-acetyltransferase [Nesterenkonia xinjiangensis]|uniref:GNAT superfamily N-acetyltransferase n=1 Tax=Nesterenkonia xinjiangensis TaxID=225327 RepID=A0A7Z0K9P3_9MICC|nr:GNAT family N-acetyltransferase [Nesterenkonia xinjiangensis]NYJ77435.1 GNAT superfamily N-acetyltransferase [Nesterenkonia xinjiangensis]
MSLTEQTRQIVKLAWSRMLRLEDTDLDLGDPSVRVEAVEDDAAAVTFVRLFDRTVIFGPSEVVGDARRLDDDLLAQERTLLDLVRAHHGGARALGAAQLFYCEEPPQVSPPSGVAVSFEPEHVAELMAACPADDVAGSGLADAVWAATLVADRASPQDPQIAEEQVLSAAGREVWQQMIAQLGVLSHPEHRGRGHGRCIAAVAMEEAFVDGLIPQWRAALENPSSRRAAIRLGFTLAGSQTTVVLE